MVSIMVTYCTSKVMYENRMLQASQYPDTYSGKQGYAHDTMYVHYISRRVVII